MSRDLNLTNQLPQTVRVFAWEDPTLKAADLIVRGEALVGVTMTIAAAISAAPAFIGSVSAVSSIEDLIGFGRGYLQAAKKTASFLLEKVPNNLVALMESLEGAFDASMARVAAGATVQILEEGIWEDILTIHGWAAIANASTVSLFLISADQTKFATFQSNPEANWTVSESGLHDATSGKSVPWDGAAFTQHRPALATSIVDRKDGSGVTFVPWLFWRADNSEVRSIAFIGGTWQKLRRPPMMTSLSAPAAACHSATKQLYVAGVKVDSSSFSQYAVADMNGVSLGVQGFIDTYSSATGGVALSDDPNGGMWAMFCSPDGLVWHAHTDNPTAPGSWSYSTNVQQIACAVCPSLLCFRMPGNFLVVFFCWLQRGDVSGQIQAALLSDDGWYPTTPGPIPGAFSAFPPALVWFNNRVYIAWIASDKPNQIWMTDGALDVHGFLPPRLVPGLTAYGPPALTAAGSYLLMTWVGQSGSILFTISTDGINWMDAQEVPVMCDLDFPPALIGPSVS